MVEAKDGAVDERLEASELELLNLHPLSRPSPKNVARRDVTSHIVKDAVYFYRQPRVQGKGKREEASGHGRGEERAATPNYRRGLC
jgi:ribosomal protein L4